MTGSGPPNALSPTADGGANHRKPSGTGCRSPDRKSSATGASGPPSRAPFRRQRDVAWPSQGGARGSSRRRRCGFHSESTVVGAHVNTRKSRTGNEGSSEEDRGIEEAATRTSHWTGVLFASNARRQAGDIRFVTGRLINSIVLDALRCDSSGIVPFANVAVPPIPGSLANDAVS